MTEERTVLLVESDIVVRSPLAEYLRECGYRVLEASSTREARQYLADQGRVVDVVMADIEVADEGGFALAALVREQCPGVAIVLAATVEKAAERASDLCKEGPTIAKPYDHQLVVDRIRRMIAARERATESR